MTSDQRVSRTITGGGRPKPIIPQETDRDTIPVARQWVLAIRRFARLAIERSDYVIREIDERLYPEIRHVEGCGAIDDDNVHCSGDVYRTEHVEGCASIDDPSKLCECTRVQVSVGCPDRELRMSLKAIRASLQNLIEAAPVRKFGADEEYHFPTRDGYTAMVVEIEYLRDRLAELVPEEPARLGSPEIVKALPETAPEKDHAEARS